MTLNSIMKKNMADLLKSFLPVCASFVSYMLVTLGLSSIGAFYNQLLWTFNESQLRTAWVPSLQVATGAILGVCIAPRVRTYGCRVMTFIGSIIGCIGYFLASFSKSLIYMYLTFGLLVGISNGFLFYSAAVNIQVTFRKRRTLATALATCGVSAAVFVFPSLARILTDHYGWRGCVMISGAFYLQGAIAAQFMATVSMTCPKNEDDVNSRQPEKTNNEKLAAQITTDNDDMDIENVATESKSHPKAAHLWSKDEDKYLCDDSLYLKDISTEYEQRYSYKCESKTINEDIDSQQEQHHIEQQTQQQQHKEQKQQTQDQQHIEQQAQQFTNYDNSSLTPQLETTTDPVHSKGSCDICVKFIQESLNFNLLKNHKFVLFLVGSCTTTFGYFVPVLFLPVRITLSLGFSDNTVAQLLTCIGISVTVGRLVSGALGDSLLVKHRTAHYAVPILIVGVINILSATLSSIALMTAYSILYGFFTGFYFVAQQPLLVELLGVEKFAQSFGVFTLFSGITALLAQPFAGFLVDWCKNYALPFIVSGTLQVCGAMLILSTTLPILNRHTKLTNNRLEMDQGKETDKV